MAKVEKYMFDRSFDAPLPTAAVAEPVLPPEPEAPPAPTFSEDELAFAKQEAYLAGQQEGLRQGLSEQADAQSRMMQQQLDDIGARLIALLTEQTNRFLEARENTLKIALAIAHKLLPHYLEKQGEAEIIAAVEKVMTEMGQEPRLVVRVSDKRLDNISTTLEDMAKKQGFAGVLVYMADERLGEADCRVEWADGGMERLSDEIWQRMDKAAADMLGITPKTLMAADGRTEAQPETDMQS